MNMGSGADKTPARLRAAANALSIVRIIGAPVVASMIAFSNKPRSWGMAGAVAGMALTDRADGMLARKANELDGQKSTETGKWLDQMADKVMTHSLMAGMAIRAFRDGRTEFGAALATNQVVQFGRDALVTQARKDAQTSGVSTAAQHLGKVKAATLFGAVIANAAPIVPEASPAREIAESAIVAAFTTGTALSVASGVSLVRSMREQRETPPAETEEAPEF